MHDLVRLRRTLGVPGLTRLVSQLVARIEHGRPFDAPVILRAPSTEERRAVSELLGRLDRGGTNLTVTPQAITQALRRAGISDDLRAAVLTLSGSVTIRAARRPQPSKNEVHEECSRPASR